MSELVDEISGLVAEAMASKGYTLTGTDIGFDGEDESYYKVGNTKVCIEIGEVDL